MNPEILRRLEQFERRGLQLKRTLSQKLKSASDLQDWGGLATEILGSEYLPRGTKRRGKKIAHKKLSNRKKQVEEQAADMADQWLRDVVQYLGTVSRLTPSLTARGNSSQLVKKLNYAKSAVKARTKISRGLVAIDQLKNYDLLYNKDIKTVLQEKKLEKAESGKYDYLAKDAKNLLKNYQTELESFLGAIERFEQGGLDAYRQSMSSCRTCIENLIKKKTGENKWRDGLRQITSSKTKRKTVEMTFDYLSGYGIHGPGVPEEEDAKTGIEQTMASIRIIMSGGGK